VEPKVRNFGVADILHKTQDLFQHLVPLVQRTLDAQAETAGGNGRSPSGSTN
jgi:hypothetical protein